MHNIYVKNILDICKGKLLTGDKDLILENFSKDTRNINKGDVYIAIKGESFDGNKFIDDAFLQGASCCIIDNDQYIDIDKYKDYVDIIDQIINGKEISRNGFDHLIWLTNRKAQSSN